MVEVLVPAAEQAEIPVEPAPVGMKGGVRPEVPLADGPGRIAGPAEHVGDGGLVKGQADGRVLGEPCRVILVPEPLLVAAGQQPGPGRRAEGVRNVPVRADERTLRQGVEVRRGDIAATLEAKVGISQVIRHDDDNVGQGRRLGHGRRGQDS
jgi:hypothetical protein